MITLYTLIVKAYFVWISFLYFFFSFYYLRYELPAEQQQQPQQIRRE